MDFSQSSKLISVKKNSILETNWKFSCEHYLGSSSLFNRLTFLTSCNLPLLSHHMNVSSQNRLPAVSHSDHHVGAGELLKEGNDAEEVGDGEVVAGVATEVKQVLSEERVLGDASSC